jgi:hypothetical protein
VRNRLELYVFCNKHMPPEVSALSAAAWYAPLVLSQMIYWLPL